MVFLFTRLFSGNIVWFLCCRSAILNFQTEGECKEAKEALTSQLGQEVKILHPSRHIGNEEILYIPFRVIVSSV